MKNNTTSQFVGYYWSHLEGLICNLELNDAALFCYCSVTEEMNIDFHSH